MKSVSDNEIRLLVEEKMSGNMRLEEDETEDQVFEEYFNHSQHTNWVINDDIDGFLCVSEYEDYVIVNFAWYDGSFAARKKMVELGRHIHNYYRNDRYKRVLYSGQKNYYLNHSKEFMSLPNVWELML